MTEDYKYKEAGCFTSPKVGRDSSDNCEDDIRVKQDKNSVSIEYPEDMTPDKITEAEAYAMLFALGGYTYTNIVEEGTNETTSTVNEGEKVANDGLVDGDDGAESSSKVDEESLNRQKAHMSKSSEGLIDPCLVKPSNLQGS